MRYITAGTGEMTRVIDQWTNDTVLESPDRDMEAEAGRLNGQEALPRIEAITAHIEHVLNDLEGNSGHLMEDVHSRLEELAMELRGILRDPKSEDHYYYPMGE